MNTHMFDNTTNTGSSGQEGSSVIGNVPANPSALGASAGETSKEANVDYEAMYKELESKIGKQGQELGEYRSFFEGIAPLLDKLDKSPELVQAIIDGKLDADLAKAALDGKVSVAEAEMVNKAHAEVKKDLGNEKYENMTPDSISKLIEEKVEVARKELEGKVKESEDLRNFEREIQDFVERTPDFAEYAKEIDAWLDEHDTTDIAVAYYAVKGQISERDAKAKAEVDSAEAAKNAALDASGGSSIHSYVEGDSELVDQLIAGKANPNVF